MPFGGLLVAGIGGIAGLAGAGGASAAGIGKNAYKATNFGDTSQYNPNAFNYQGTPGGANDASTQYDVAAQQAQMRQAPQADYNGANGANAYSNLGNSWDTVSQQDRASQAQAQQLMMQRAQGLVPSIASMQGANDMRTAQAAQMAAAASARGPAGLALAQQGAANNVANAQGQISNQTQINAANERLQAEQAAFGAGSTMRQGDQTSQANAYQQSQNAAQQQQYNANLQQQQMAQNNAYSLGMTGNAVNVNTAQLNAQGNQQGMLANSLNNQQGTNATVTGANAQNEWKPVQMALGAVQGGASMGASTQAGAGAGAVTPAYGGITGQVTGTPLQGTRAGGGPVRAGGMYLVGERGPELIVPQHGGLVVPAPQTHAIMSYGGLLSDDRAKLNAAKLEGFQHGMSLGMKNPQGGWNPADIPEYAMPKGPDGQPMRADGRPDPDSLQAWQSAARDAGAPGAVQGPGAPWGQQATDPTTAQLGQGLAPISFEYKPGMGPPGVRPGIRAQGALTTAMTAPMVDKRPDGLYEINQQQGLGTALAGVGHLAKKVAQHDEMLRAERGR